MGRQERPLLVEHYHGVMIVCSAMYALAFAILLCEMVRNQASKAKVQSNPGPEILHHQPVAQIRVVRPKLAIQ